jgi:hypothetical protein
VDDRSKPSGFVSLRSIKHGPPDAVSALAEIRRMYFRTTKKTIEHDLAHAIELLKSLPNEEAREKASVFMEGMAQMRREWGAEKTGKTGTRTTGAGKTGRTGSHGGTGKQRRTGNK